MQLKTFFKDAGSNYAVFGMQMAYGLFSIPIFLSTYGESVYGLYLLTLSFATSLSFLQFGSGDTMFRYTAEFIEDADEVKYGVALRTSAVLILACIAGMILLFTFFAHFHSYIFSIPAELSSMAYYLFLISGIYGAIYFAGELPRALLKGAAIFYQRNKFVAFELSGRIVLLVCIYLYQLSIYTVAFAEVGLLIFGLALDYLVLSRHPTVLLRKSLLKRVKGVKLFQGEIWTYAKSTFLIGLTSFFSQSADRVILAILVDVQFVAIYNIITKPFQLAKSLLQKSFVVVGPYFIQTMKRGGKLKLERFVHSTTVVYCTLVVGACLIGIFYLPSLIQLWMQTRAYDEYVIYAQLLFGALGIRTIGTLYTIALYAVGETQGLLRINYLVVTVNVLIGIIATRYIGMGGVIVGTCIQIILTTPLVLRLASKYFLTEDAMRTRMISRWLFWYAIAIIASLGVLLGSIYLSQTFGDMQYLLCGIPLTLAIVNLAIYLDLPARARAIQKVSA